MALPCFAGRALFAVAILLWACSAQWLSAAEEPAVAVELTPAIKARVLSALRSARPDLSYGDVEPSPIRDISMVKVENGPILYVHNDGEFFFDGDLYQVRPGRFVNLREEALTVVRRDLINQVPIEQMIVFAPEGKTEAVVNVFTDVDCGYCRKLHREVPQLNAMGIEVRYLAYPRAGIGSEAYRKIASAWCAEEPNAALTALKNGESIEENVCAGNPVQSHYQLGGRLGVNGTPALVLSDGSLLPGYRPAADLARVLGVVLP